MITKRHFLRMGILLLCSLGFVGLQVKEKWRYVKILQPDKTWKRAEFDEIKKWDWFRIFDSNGKPAHWDIYEKEYVYQSERDAFAISDPPAGNWGITINKMIEFEKGGDTWEMRMGK